MEIHALQRMLAARYRELNAANQPPPQPKTPQAKWGRPLLIATSLIVPVILVSCLAWGIQPFAESWLVLQWRGELQQIADPLRAEGMMSQAARQGSWGMRLLVAATSSENIPARFAAVAQLENLLNQWENEPGLDHSQDVFTLVQLVLAEQAHYTPEQTSQVTPLAQRLLDWPVSSNKIEMPRYLRESEELARFVLSATPLPPSSSDILIDQPIVATKPPAIVSPPAPPPNVYQDSPTGDSPQPLAGQQSPQPTTTDSSLGPIPAPTPTPLAVPSIASQPSAEVVRPEDLPSPAPDPRLMLEMLPAEPDQIKKLSDSDEQTNPPRMIPLDSPQSDPIAGDFQSDAWNKLSDWEVIQRLSSQGSMAEAVLRRRGYRDRDLAIARQAADIDPSVRLNLVRQLPRVNGIDARLWLEQLAEDEDREVRQTAAAILRTANSSR